MRIHGMHVRCSTLWLWYYLTTIHLILTHILMFHLILRMSIILVSICRLYIIWRYTLLINHWSLNFIWWLTDLNMRISRRLTIDILRLSIDLIDTRISACSLLGHISLRGDWLRHILALMDVTLIDTIVSVIWLILVKH